MSRFNHTGIKRRFAVRLRSSEVVTSVILAVVVGVVAGFGAVAFRWLIKSFQRLFFSGGASVLGFMGDYYIILLPAAGGLLVGLLIHFGAREAKGHGVPEVMEAVAIRGGRIRPRVALVKSLASSICIGSGGSVGREGPIVQIGSSLGSTVGQVFKVPTMTQRTMVGCGAAAGIAATFNAPIAGVLFAIEVLLRDVSLRSFLPIILFGLLIALTMVNTTIGSILLVPAAIRLTNINLNKPSLLLEKMIPARLAESPEGN